MNLTLPVHQMLEPVAAYLAFANRLPNPGLSVHMPPGKSLPTALLPIAAALAVHFLVSWNEPITDNFYSRASQWFDNYWMSLPEAMKAYVRPWIAEAWQQRSTTFEQPIARAERLAGLNKRSLVVPKAYDDIYRDLLAALPN